MLLGQRGGGEGVSSTSYKIFANSFRLAHIIKAPCVQEVCHKSPGSAITSEDLAVAVGGADDGDGDSSGGSGGGSGGGGGGVDVEERGGPRVVSPLLPPLRLPRVIAVVVMDQKEREHGVAWPGVT